MVNLAWDAFSDTTCDSYNVYRSIPGISIPFPNSLVAGDVFTFAATSQTQQNVTFSAVDIASVVAQFNAQARGAYAVATNAGSAVLIRLTATKNPKLKTYPCTFLTHLGLTPGITVPQLTWSLIGNVPFVTGLFSYAFSDVDGTYLDAYQITSVIGSTQSLPSIIQTPQLGTDLLCAVEGRVADSANRPVHALIIRAQIRIPMAQTDGRGIDGDEVETQTDVYGRFSLYLTRGCIYLLQIPAVGYNETVCIPDLPSVGFLDLIPTLADRFSPFGDPQ